MPRTDETLVTSERPADEQQGSRAPLRAWIGLGVLTLTFFMAAVDMSIVFLALPSIAADLEPGATQQLWVLHVGDIVGAGLVLTVGRLADRFGARRVLVVSVIAYGAASALAAMSTSVEMLIVARALLGASAVAFGPAGMILLRRLFTDGKQFATAIGVFMAAFSGGMALGPPIGGFLLDAFAWNAVFLINVPVALLAVGAAWILPAVPARAGGRLDVLSVLQSILGVALFVNGVQETAAQGPQPVPLASVVVGLVLAALFVRRQRRLDDPLLDLSLFRSRAFTFGILGIIGVILAQTGADMQMAQHLQAVMGLSPRDAGLVLMVPAVLTMIATIAAPALLRWFTPAQVIGGGMLLSVGGALVVAATAGLSGSTPSAAAVVGGLTVLEVGIGPMFGLGAGLIVASAPEEHVGSASAVQDVSGGLGNSIGLTIGGTLAFVVYQALLGPRLPDDLAVQDRGAASDSIGAALATAERLPSATGDALAEAARESFATATQGLFLMSAVVLTVVAVMVLRGLRGARLDAHTD